LRKPLAIYGDLWHKSVIESLPVRSLAVRDIRCVTESWCHSVIDLFFPEVTIKRSRPTAAPQSNLPRMNERIRISPIRVVSATGEMLGEMETAAALRIAMDEGLDLVEVSPEARPPVCRIMNYGKVIYERQKKTSGPKQHKTQLKQLRLRAKTGQHDIETKVRQARDFLVRRDKVKINVMFKGRENAHHERGIEMLDEVVKSLADVASVEQAPRMESGKMMSVLLTPLKH
jgi:translation initiation factor IF-3